MLHAGSKELKMTQCASRADGTRACDGNLYGRGPVGVLSLSGSHRNVFSQSVTWYRSKFCNDCFCCCGENVLEGKGNACGETSWDGSVKASWEKNGVWNGRPAVERHAYSEPDLAWQWLNWALGLVFMGWGFCKRQEEIIFWGNLRSRGDRYDQYAFRL